MQKRKRGKKPKSSSQVRERVHQDQVSMASSVEREVDRGIRLHTQGDIAKAEVCYRNALATDPNQARALQMLGVVAIQRGNYVSAQPLIEKSLQISPENAQALFNHGLLLQQLSQSEAAAVSYEKARKLSPFHVSTLSNLGAVYVTLKEYTKAENVLTAALSLEPQRLDILNNLGLCLLGQKKYTHAALQFEKVLKLGGCKANPLNSLGSIHQRLGDLSSAIEYYRAALRVDPCHTAASSNLATALVASEDRENAIKQYQRTLVLNPYCLPSMIGAAIQHWLLEDVETVSLYLGKIAQIGFDQLDTKQRQYVLGYHRFLTALCDYQSKYSVMTEVIEDKTKPVHIIGDSHCLSYVQQKIGFAGQMRDTVPHLVVGCKAWHLANENDNEYKTAFRNSLIDVDDEAHVFLVFGEIDCRLNEGILPQVNRKGASSRLIAKALVEDFVEFTSRQCDERNIVPYYLNVPAPVRLDEYSDSDAEAVGDVVSAFNEALAVTLARRFPNETRLIDLYSVTRGSHLMSDGQHHLDKIHLKPQGLKAALALTLAARA